MSSENDIWTNKSGPVLNLLRFRNFEIIFPGNLTVAATIYLFKVNNRNKRITRGICSKLTIKTPEVVVLVSFFVNCGHISHFILMFEGFEQVNTGSAGTSLQKRTDIYGSTATNEAWYHTYHKSSLNIWFWISFTWLEMKNIIFIKNKFTLIWSNIKIRFSKEIFFTKTLKPNIVSRMNDWV